MKVSFGTSALCLLPSALYAAEQDALHPAGPQAAPLANLWWWFFWICTIFYVVLLGFFFMAIVRGRRNTVPDVSEGTEKRLGSAVITALAISVVGLLGLLVASVAVGHEAGRAFAKNPGQLEIEVTGHQWWWEVKYPDALVPSHQIVTANEIHIPIHTPILLRLDTRDVIHSLWIPNLHGKRDLIPGRVNKFWIQADRPGVYRGQCAEFCGLQHAHMSLVVVSEKPEQFAEWKSHQSEGAPTPLTPQQARGQQVFLGAPCSNCHNITGIDASATLGPDLTHFRSRSTLAAGTLLNTRGNLAGWIANAPAIKPGAQMPPNQLSATELQDLLAYLDTLK
jgi:cytochrome c oxidase subunit 2